jgi:uncharacterized protein (DUF2062 family)
LVNLMTISAETARSWRPRRSWQSWRSTKKMSMRIYRWNPDEGANPHSVSRAALAGFGQLLC